MHIDAFCTEPFFTRINFSGSAEQSTKELDFDHTAFCSLPQNLNHSIYFQMSFQQSRQ